MHLKESARSSSQILQIKLAILSEYVGVIVLHCYLQALDLVGWQATDSKAFVIDDVVYGLGALVVGYFESW